MTTNRKSIDNESQKPALWKLISEPSRAALGLGAFYLSKKRMLAALPKGDGHPIMVIPGFVASDVSTIPMRTLLNECGYQTHAWKMGMNLGKTFYLDVLYDKVNKIYKQTGQKVSLIGWSLGGVYAREIARQHPEAVRQVITMGTPFAGLFEPSHAKWLHEVIHGDSYQDLPEGFMENILTTPPVPVSAIYSKGDGIVHWEHCLEKEENATTQNIQVLGSHCGLGHNNAVLYCIGNRLAQAEDNWQPFEPQGAWSLLFPGV